MNYMLIDQGTNMLSGLGSMLWPEAVNTTYYLMNRSPALEYKLLWKYDQEN